MGVEYDGTAYNGWQKQDMGIGIQTIIEDAISKIANCEINVVCAGRTDAGVHALNQVIHFDVLIDRSIYSWQTGVNSLLPPDVNVNWAEVVSNEFHARFSAIQRTYQYQINNRKIRSSLMRNRYWWVHQNLDELIMQKGAEILESPVTGGQHTAISGNISILVGGKRKNFNRAFPLLSLMG